MPPSDGAGARRLDQLLGLPVEFADGRRAGFVNDVRVSSPAGGLPLVDGILVDGRHAGSLLGYDRRRHQGPWLLGWVVRRLHSGAGYVPWEQVRGVDWTEGLVRLATDRMEPPTSAWERDD